MTINAFFGAMLDTKLMLNSVKKHPERITKEDKKLPNNLNYEGSELPISKNDYCKVEKQNNVCITMFYCESKIIYPLYISSKKFSDCMDLKSHYVYIKDFNRLMFNKTKNKNKKYFRRCCLQCFSSEKVLTKHKENCLVIKGKQKVKLGKGSISFQNYSKQLAVLFKIYVDFECILRPTLSKKGCNKSISYTEKYQDHVPCSFTYKVAFVDNKFSQDVVLYRGKKCCLQIY